MNANVRKMVLRLLRVPHEPVPPAGAPGSLRVFRAGRKFWWLRVAGWAGKQTAAAIGILFSLYFIHQMERNVPDAAVPEGAKSELYAVIDQIAPQAIGRVARKVPTDALFWIKLAEGVAIAGFCIQLPLTLAAARLDYDYRWYMVTDRSLRLRYGLTTVHETTMSFANVQQVKVSQGPFERLLGLADVEVESAGGGGGGTKAEHKSSEQDSMHRGVFLGVENAEEIRDLVLSRLRRYREAGLGDTDDVAAMTDEVEPATGPVLVGADALVAARVVLAEVRALRATAERRA